MALYIFPSTITEMPANYSFTLSKMKVGVKLKKKQQLFSNKDAEVITRPKVCEQVGTSEMLMLGEWKKKFKLAKVEFKD